jgi:hypothetical protein
MGIGQDVERPLVGERRPDALEDPRHSLDVVREHLRARLGYLHEKVLAALEVGDHVLHASAGVDVVDPADRLGVQPGAAVWEVVSRDAGDGGVAQARRVDALGHPARFVAVDRLRPAGVDLAEVAAPGALVTPDEERRLVVLPAFDDVRAARLLAHGVQSLGPRESARLAIPRARPDSCLGQLRFPLDRGPGVADFEPRQSVAVRRHAGHVTGSG